MKQSFQRARPEMPARLRPDQLEASALCIHERVSAEHADLLHDLGQLRVVGAPAGAKPQLQIAPTPHQPFKPASKPGANWRIPPIRWAIRVYVHLWDRYPRQRATLHLWRTRLRPLVHLVRRAIG